MKLKHVLRRHDVANVRNGIRDSLGDSFLLRENPAYNLMRKLALEDGARFVPAWENYRRASLFELPTILKKKTVPYNDSVPTLRRLVRQHRIDEEMIDVPVNLVSSHFHEAAHVIADAAFKRVKPRTAREKILVALLCESYANASESLAVAFVDGDVHRFFFEQNSYIYADAARSKDRRRALKLWGAEGSFRFLWLTYLYSNFLVEKISRAELEGLLRFSLRTNGVTEADVRLATSLFNDAYELSETFRLKTARIYLRALGLKGDVKKNLRFDFSKVFLSRRLFLEAFDELSRRTTAPLSSASSFNGELV